MFNSNERRFLGEQKYKSALQESKGEIARGEPLHAVDTLIALLQRTDIKEPTSKILRDTAREILAQNYYKAIGREDRPATETALPEDELLNEVDSFVSNKGEDGLDDLASFLKQTATVVEQLEKKGLLTLGSRGKIRAGVVELLTKRRNEAKTQWPTMEELQRALESGSW